LDLTCNCIALLQKHLHTPIILSNFDPTFGGAFKAEITPFEPDSDNTDEGKKSFTFFSISSFLLPPFLVRKPKPNWECTPLLRFGSSIIYVEQLKKGLQK